MASLIESPVDFSEPKPAPGRSGSSSWDLPRRTTAASVPPPRRTSVDAGFLLGVSVLFAGALAIAPLYLHNIVQDAKVDGLERAEQGQSHLSVAIGRRLGGFEASLAAKAPAQETPPPNAIGCELPGSELRIADGGPVCTLAPDGTH